MEKIKKDLNDSNKEIVKQLSGLYNKLSNSIEQSYYQGQKSAYEEMLVWFKNSQNNSVKFISPKTVKNYLIEKGAKSKNILNDKKNSKDKENNSKRTNKANFNYLYYDQVFNKDNTVNKNNNEFNVYPTSVENALYNNNKSNNPFNFVFNNNIKNSEDNFHLSILKNSSTQNDKYQMNNTSNSLINNNSDDSFEEPMKSQNYLNNNFLKDYNLKRKK